MTGDTEPVVGDVGVVGGRMLGKDRAVNTGDLTGQERRETPVRSQSHHSSDEASNDRGAKDDRKEDHQSERQSEASSPAVPATGKQDEEALWQHHKAQRGVWSEKMLMALEGGVKGAERSETDSRRLPRRGERREAARSNRSPTRRPMQAPPTK